MTKIQLEIHDNVIVAINKIKVIHDIGIDLEIPEGSVLFDNVLNLRLIQKEADKLEKTVHFNTTDRHGLALLTIMEEEVVQDFVVKEVDIEEPQTSAPAESHLRLPKFRPKLPKLGAVLALLIILGIIGGIGYLLLWHLPTADIEIVVNAQPLTKSVQIRVLKDGTTDAAAKTLKGSTIETVLTNTAEIDTTGEKIIGEKAKGEIKIFNKTTTEKAFKKGTTLIYNDDELRYTLGKDVTVAAAVETTDAEGALIITAGEAKVDIMAKEIGDKYNIDEDEKMEFEDFDSDDYTIRTDTDIDGGKSDTVNIVGENDASDLSLQAYDAGLEKAQMSLEKIKGTVFIKGSQDIAIIKEEFSAEAGEEKETLELVQEVRTTGLAYTNKDLKSLLDKLLEDFIPDGYELSTKDTDITAEVLGNADNTIVTDTEADLQVTIKAYVIPRLDTKDIKESLVSKDLAEAQKILGSLKNINTYKLEVTPNIPYLTRIPRNTEKISIELKRED